MSEHSRVSITDEERRTVTGSELTDDIGIDDAEIQFQTAFTQFSTQGRACLESTSDTVDRNADDLRNAGHVERAPCARETNRYRLTADGMKRFS